VASWAAAGSPTTPWVVNCEIAIRKILPCP
jgi:hypothetical protein